MAAEAVVVTGIGLVTPAGIGIEANWQRVVAGEATAAPDKTLEAMPVGISCRVPSFDSALLGVKNPWHSFSELERDARSAQHARLAGAQTTLGHVEQCLGGSAPVVAATDYVRAYAQLIAPYVSAPFKVLGTDGFGCSDTRRALRRYFEVDSQAICLTALQALVEQGRLAADTVAKARRVMDGTDNRHA